MVFRLVILIVFALISRFGIAQPSNSTEKKPFFLGPTPDYHRFYIGIRFPQTYYFDSDLRLHGQIVGQILTETHDIDVTLANWQSQDEGFVYAALFRTLFQNAAAPPYVISFGYKFKNSNFGIGGRIIHYKQFKKSGQQNLINGYVGNDVYNNFYGEAPFLINYENTDGHNIYTLGVDFTYTIIRSKNQKHWLDALGFVGPGLSYPRTDATIRLPDGAVRQRNNDFKVAGGGMVFEAGFMGTIFNHLTFTLEGNFTIIRNSDMYIISDGISDLRGSQTISAFSWSTGIAFTFPVKPYKKLRKEAKAANN